jgi:hypothetical protein
MAQLKTGTTIAGNTAYHEGNLTKAVVDALGVSADTLTGLTATVSELNYVDGVTSNIQTQLNAKLSTTGKAADSDKLDGNDSTVFAKKTDYATSTVGGTVKARLVGDVLYLTNNGNNA